MLIGLGIVEVVENESWDAEDRGYYDLVCGQILQIAHGFARSSEQGFPVDYAGRPVPWLSRPAVEFLLQLDLSGSAVFEFGGGASTYFWSRQAASVVTAESQSSWAELLAAEAGSNCTVLHRPDPKTFAHSILETDCRYDLILLDAEPRFRTDCVKPALDRLTSGGIIILDDAPFYPDAAAELRNAGLVEVDLVGFAPLEDNVQTTSFFFSGLCSIPRRGPKSPVFPIASPNFDWSELQ